jgi:outer membrane biosynthesis protein TonB
MSPALFLDILLAWSAQICIVAAVGGLAALTLSLPKGRLLFWQGLLVLMLFLPVLEPWKQPLPLGIPAMTDTGPQGAGPVIVMEPSLWRREYWLAIIAFGCALRLLWMGIGFLRLRRYRKEARRFAQPPVPFGTGAADWYLHDHVAGPVTYGWLRPSILLPTQFEQMPAYVREAIACHELVHVERRDWLFVIAEELIRSAFWFHPAVWFVLSRIQLAREQAVDREVVRITENRDCYLDALMAVAAQKIRPDVAPAPLFLKKRHLAARVAAVLQEVSMSKYSKSRLYASVATVCSCLLVAGRLAISLFPFAGQAQVVPDDPGVTVEAGGKLLHRTPVHVPAGGNAAGAVALEVNLNPKGEVTDARVLSGPAELRRAALASVLDWHYAADSGLSQAHVTITFNQEAPALETPREAPWVGTVGSLAFVGMSPEREAELRSRLSLHEGDSFTIADQRIARTVKEFDSHFNVKLTQRRSGEGLAPDVAILIGLMPEQAVPAAPVVALTENFPPPAAGVKRLRISGSVQARNLVSQPHPVYPPLAKQARVQGVVRFNALIGLDGAIKALQLIEGPELLTQTAAEAVKQWVYRPTLLNGDPVEVVTQIDVNFTLQQ